MGKEDSDRTASGRTTRRRFVGMGAGAVGTAGLAGCVGRFTGANDEGDDGSADGPPTLKLGIVMPESGDLKDLAADVNKALKVPGKMLNDGDGPIQVQQRLEDSKTGKVPGVKAADRLIEDGFPMIAGAFSSGVSLSVYKQSLIPNKVVGCSPGSTSPTLTSLNDGDYIYRTTPSDALQASVVAQIGAERQDNSTAAVIHLGNDYGLKLAEAFTAAFEGEYGGTVQRQVGYESGQDSYAAVVDEAMADDPELLVLVAYPASGEQIFKDYYASYDEERDILVTDAVKDVEMPSKVGNDMSNVRGTVPLATGPGLEQYKTAFDEYADGTATAAYAPEGFDATAVLLLAGAAAYGEEGELASGAPIRDQMERVANPGGTAVTAGNLAEGVQLALDGEDVEYRGAASNVVFDSNGDMKSRKYEYYQFSPEGFKQLDTISTN